MRLTSTATAKESNLAIGRAGMVGTMDLSISAVIQDAPHSSQLPLEGLMLGHERHILLLQLAGVLLPCLQLHTQPQLQLKQSHWRARVQQGCCLIVPRKCDCTVLHPGACLMCLQLVLQPDKAEVSRKIVQQRPVTLMHKPRYTTVIDEQAPDTSGSSTYWL